MTPAWKSSVHPPAGPANAHRPALDRQRWTWRGYRVLTLVAMMMDYMPPKRTMAGRKPGRVLVSRRTAARCSAILARYGITMPKCAEHIALEKDHLSHQA